MASVPAGRAGQQDRQRQQRPAHQLQFGQAPAGKRQAAAPAERVVGRLPIARAAVAAVFQVAGIEDFVRCAGRVALPQARPCAAHSPAENASATSAASGPRPVRCDSTARPPVARTRNCPATVAVRLAAIEVSVFGMFLCYRLFRVRGRKGDPIRWARREDNALHGS